MNLALKMMYLYPDAIPNEEWVVGSDRGVESIGEWRLPGERPSPELLSSLDEDDGFKAWMVQWKSALIDRKTAASINSQMHPRAPTDESIGIIRDMVVQIINAIGLAPTADFTHLNEIAIAAIKEAAARKAAIT